MKQWYEKRPKLLAAEQAELKSCYPGFRWIQRPGEDIQLFGDIYIESQNRVIDRYSVRIAVPPDYPETLPSVWETEGRVPREEDRHVNPANGTLCLFVPDERWKYVPVEETSLARFIGGPLYQFLLNQSYFERTGRWFQDGRTHGFDGVLEYYYEEFQTNDPFLVEKFLCFLATPGMKGHRLCPCNSGKKVRDCHVRLRDLHTTKIPPAVAARTLRILQPINEKRKRMLSKRLSFGNRYVK